MSLLKKFPQLIHPRSSSLSLPPWAYFVALAYSVTFLSIALIVAANQPHVLPNLLPLLIVALSLAVFLAILSLMSVRNAQNGADQAFRNTDCEFSSIFQNVLDGILIVDNEGCCLDANPAAAALLRLPTDKLVGREIAHFLADRNAFTRNWQSFLQRKSRRGRTELIGGDGTNLVVDFSAAADYLPGRHLLILCDVTERTRTELSLRRSEERFQRMATNIEEIFWVMDANSQNVTYVNHAYATITGYSVESLQNNPGSYRELIHTEDRIRVLSKLQEVLTNGRFDEEFRFVRADGEVRWIWAKGFPVRENAQTQWLVGTAQDITSRKQAEMKISEQLDVVDAARAEAEVLRKATLALSRNLAMDSVLDTLLECISELIPYDIATVLFVESAAELLVARESPHVDHKRIGLTVRLSENVFLQRVLFEKQALLLPDIAKQSEWQDIEPFDRIQSWLGIPLIAGGHVLGILSLGAHAPSTLTREHLRLAKSLAIPAAVAIENARVHERAEIYAAELALRLEELRNAQKALERKSGEPSN